MFTMGFVYELPFGKGKKWATRGFASHVFGGWQTNGTFIAYTGTPFTRLGFRHGIERAG